MQEIVSYIVPLLPIAFLLLTGLVFVRTLAKAKRVHWELALAPAMFDLKVREARARPRPGADRAQDLGRGFSGTTSFILWRSIRGKPFKTKSTSWDPSCS